MSDKQIPFELIKAAMQSRVVEAFISSVEDCHMNNVAFSVGGFDLDHDGNVSDLESIPADVELHKQIGGLGFWASATATSSGMLDGVLIGTDFGCVLIGLFDDERGENEVRIWAPQEIINTVFFDQRHYTPEMVLEKLFEDVEAVNTEAWLKLSREGFRSERLKKV